MSLRVGKQFVRSFCSRPSRRSRAWDNESVSTKREALGIRQRLWIDTMWFGNMLGRAKIAQKDVLDGAEYAYAKLVKAFGHADRDHAERALTNLLREGALGKDLYNYLKETRSVAEKRMNQRNLSRTANQSASKHTTSEAQTSASSAPDTSASASSVPSSASDVFAKFKHRRTVIVSTPNVSASSDSNFSSHSSAISASSPSPVTSASASSSISSSVAQPSTSSPSSPQSVLPVLEVHDLQAQFVLFFVPGIRKVIEVQWQELAQLPEYDPPALSLLLHPRASWRIIKNSLARIADLDNEHFAFSVVVEVFATEIYLGKEKRTSHLLRFDRPANKTEFQLVDINGAVLGMHTLSHIPD